jgi:hypothetical protein
MTDPQLRMLTLRDITLVCLELKKAVEPRRQHALGLRTRVSDRNVE